MPKCQIYMNVKVNVKESAFLYGGSSYTKILGLYKDLKINKQICTLWQVLHFVSPD